MRGTQASDVSGPGAGGGLPGKPHHPQMTQAGPLLAPPSGDCAAAAPPPTEGIVGGIDNAINLVRRVLSDLFRLFSLEARRAGLALAWMVALGAMAAILVVTAWLGLMGALALWAVALGWTWVGAMVAIALANFLIGGDRLPA